MQETPRAEGFSPRELPPGLTSAPRERPRGRRSAAHRSRPGVSFAVNIAPMIDVTFLLLIFFLVTTTFERAEGILASKLPRDTGITPAVALPISPIVVRLTQVGPGEDDYAIRIDNFKTLVPSVSDLGACFREIHGKPGFDVETPVVIVAGDQLRWDHVVGVWNAAVGVGCKNIAFAGE